MENNSNYNVFCDILIHEIGHLLIDMILENEYDDFTINRIEIMYNSRNIMPVKGKILFTDSYKTLPKEVEINKYKLLVDSGDVYRIKLTQISLLFGSLFQSMFKINVWAPNFKRILDTNGENDITSFKTICLHQGVTFDEYFCEYLFCDYFEVSLIKLRDEIRNELVKMVKENYIQFNKSEKIQNFIEKTYVVFRLEELKEKINNLDVYKEFVEAVKKYSFNT